MGEAVVAVENPIPGVRRFVLNRPEKRNAMSNALRNELLEGLREADRDEDVRVVRRNSQTRIRGEECGAACIAVRHFTCD